MPADPRDAPHERRPRMPQPPAAGGGVHVEPAPDGRGEPPRSPLRDARPRLIAVVVALLALNYVLASVVAPPERSVRVPYSPYFLDQVRAGNVGAINTEGDAVTGEFRRPVRYPDRDSQPARTFETQLPAFADGEELEDLLQRHGVEVTAEPLTNDRGLLLTLLIGFGPVVLLVALFVWMARRASRGGGALNPLGGFGRSRARRSEASRQRVSFEDVAGIDEAKAELTEVVDFLRNPDKYRRLGGRIPRGVLLSGQPGTGKTLLARAVAGEAGVPFFSLSASEFVEAIVGVGAARVRDLFKQAKEAAPAIIFVDELDAVGRARSAGGGLGSGANDEREQTLNQILTEMDGFESEQTVIVLAATNRPEVLDPALLRPGRFDRRVTVPAPDREGRRRILEVHTRSVPLADDVDLDQLAATTPGMVGADLANLCNEAALLAARREHERVERADLADALEKILLGVPRSMVLSEEDRRRTAYHEAGHAVVGMLTPGADPVRKVSIIPRGMSLGVTLSTPDTDRVSYDQNALEAKIDVALGGRVAEELLFDSVTTGAESDIQQVTQIARAMVGRWGMSPQIGFVAVLPRDGVNPLLPGAEEPSEATQRLVDEEVRRLVDEAHERVSLLLRDNRAALDALTAALLESETLDQAAAYAAAGVAPSSGGGSSGSAGAQPAGVSERSTPASSSLPRR